MRVVSRNIRRKTGIGAHVSTLYFKSVKWKLKILQLMQQLKPQISRADIRIGADLG
jgi:hypothetical protein